ncbi:MAG: tryptophan--tRNA ligase [Candidatus Peribacteraceae bacterium]
MRVLSAIQPSGTLHLGNYFGSIKPNLDLAASASDSVYFIADLHALTTVQDAEKLRQYRVDAALDLLACGLDPVKTTLFYQSDVSAHAELAWILSTVTPMGLLERAVSYKDKVEKGITASVGLFTYPVLMATDILLYHADTVPVGKDQKQHVEMIRDIAIKFNNTFDTVFTLPEPKIMDDVAVVPGTDGQKMSKSYGNTIPLFGDEKVIKKAISGIVTDSKGVEEKKDPDTCTVFKIHRLFLSESEQKDLAAKYKAGGLGYGDAKKMLLETYMDVFSPMREARAALEKKPKEVAAILAEGAKKASERASETLHAVFQATGLAPSA